MLRCQIWSKDGYVVCEELVGSAVKNLLKNNFGCTVGAEVVGPANGLEVIVSLFSVLLQKVYVKMSGLIKRWLCSL